MGFFLNFQSEVYRCVAIEFHSHETAQTYVWVWSHVNPLPSWIHEAALTEIRQMCLPCSPSKMPLLSIECTRKCEKDHQLKLQWRFLWLDRGRPCWKNLVLWHLECCTGEEDIEGLFPAGTGFFGNLGRPHWDPFCAQRFLPGCSLSCPLPDHKLFFVSQRVIKVFSRQEASSRLFVHGAC